MAISNEFMEAVNAGKTTRVRIMLKDALLLDPTCKKFNEMFSYANDKMSDLVVEHDGEAFKDSLEWDEDYLNEEMVAVVSNFSRERIDLLKRMVQKLYGKSSKNMQMSSYSETNVESENSSFSDMQKAGIAVTVVGAGMLVGGLAVPTIPKVVPVIGGVVACVGIGMVILGKK